MPPRLVLHAVPPSHPCMAADRALRVKGLPFERVDLTPGRHPDEMERLYGAGHRTVPGLMVDDEPVHGSIAILERLEADRARPAALPRRTGPTPSTPPSAGPTPSSRTSGAACRGGRCTSGPRRWGPSAAPARSTRPARTSPSPTRGGRGATTAITAQRLADDLAGLPAKLDHVDALVADGVIGADEPTAADLQIGATLRVLLTVGDLRALLEDRPAGALARRWFPDYPGDIPAGAFPAGWVPARA